MLFGESTVIIDMGSNSTRIGFSGDDYPREVFPTIHGRYKSAALSIGISPDPGYSKYNGAIGDDAASRRGVMSIVHPVEQGVITRWEEAEAIWKYSYDQLNVDAAERAVLVTEPPFNPLRNREKMAQVFFEEHNVPAFYSQTSPVLALMSTGRLTGLCVDIGTSSASFCPVYYGERVSHAMMKSHIGGENLGSHLVNLLIEKGISISTTSERKWVDKLKEEHGYVALDYSDEMNKYRESSVEIDRNCTYSGMDEIEVTIGTERFRACEPLFHPSLVGFSMYGLPDMIWQSAQRLDPDTKPEICKEIVLTGGTATLPGLKERVQKELDNLFGPKFPLKVLCSVDRYAAYAGASLMASIESYEKAFISKQDYDETGPTIINRASP